MNFCADKEIACAKSFYILEENIWIDCKDFCGSTQIFIFADSVSILSLSLSYIVHKPQDQLIYSEAILRVFLTSYIQITAQFCIDPNHSKKSIIY